MLAVLLTAHLKSDLDYSTESKHFPYDKMFILLIKYREFVLLSTTSQWSIVGLVARSLAIIEKYKTSSVI